MPKTIQSNFSRLQFNSVAKMKASNPRAGDIIYTSGYYSTNDGGEGQYLVKTSGTPDEKGDHTLANGYIAQLQNENGINAKQFGCKGDNSTDDTASLVAAQNAAIAKSEPTVFFPQGTYVVTNYATDQTVQFVGENSSIKQGTDVYNLANRDGETSGTITFYVNPTGSDTANNGLTTSTPFKTLQYAYDYLPTIINHDCTIQLADGTHNQNYRAAGDLVRAALLYAAGKYNTARTERESNRLKGSILIKGNTSDKTAVILEKITGYDTAIIYNTQFQLAVDSMTLKGKAGESLANMIMSHRGSSYVHCNDLVLDGISVSDTTGGVSCESGGNLELTGNSSVANCANGARVQNEGDNMNISADTVMTNCTRGALAQLGTIGWEVTGTVTDIFPSGVTEAFLCEKGGHLNLRGLGGSPNRMKITPTVTITGQTMDATFVDFENVLVLEGAFAHFDNCGWQSELQVKGGHIHIRSSESYTTGNTQSSSTKPLQIFEGGSFSEEGTVVLKDSTGATYYPHLSSVVSASNGVIVSVEAFTRTVQIDGSGANRTGWILQTANAYYGQKIQIIGNTWGADFPDNASQQIAAGGTLSIGNDTGRYLGATFVFNGTKWIEQGRSLVN